jgi:RNA polymerase sigma-70 factor (ECF subfamily)
VPDDRLRLVFTCCHPSLAPEAQVALTLRLVCGVATPEVARAFLVPEATMAARLTRAKKKIAQARIPYRVPDRAELPARLDSVLTAVHLLFSTGHTAPHGDDLVRSDVCERAIHLARVLVRLLPDRPEDARPARAAAAAPTRAGRYATDAEGRCCCSPTRDRSRWDQRAIVEGLR